jgi:hypothetical protein
MGYEASPIDKCVFRQRVGDRIFYLLLYVDDILALVDKEEAETIRSRLQKQFGEIVFEAEKRLSYLRMEIQVMTKGTVIDMTFYVPKLLEGLEVEVYESPGTKNTFIVDETSKRLIENEQKEFHSRTARLLYLAKRARPDILTVTIFLCTCVQEATVEDQRKLALRRNLQPPLWNTLNRTN